MPTIQKAYRYLLCLINFSEAAIMCENKGGEMVSPPISNKVGTYSIIILLNRISLPPCKYNFHLISIPLMRLFVFYEGKADAERKTGSYH